MKAPAQLNPQIRTAWYIGCQDWELKRKPLKRKILGTPLVLFRDADGVAHALLDRCPHRGVALSGGKVINGQLQCPYHGWEFAGDGRCKRVPALVGEPDVDNRCATSFPVVEQQGFVWVYPTAGPMPQSEPWRFKYIDDPDYLIVRYEVRADATVHAVAENALDVPHTAFLHGGLFRNDANRNRIKAVIKRWQDRVECEYVGEPRPSGLVGTLLSPSGGVVTHFDRFYLPSVVEVEYRIGDENHVIVNGACTPVDDTDTRLYSVTALRTRLPGFVVRPFVQPVALQIFGQDKGILKEQTELAAQFGDVAYVSTEVDTVGPHILKLMWRAARGEPIDPDVEPWTKTIEMDI